MNYSNETSATESDEMSIQPPENLSEAQYLDQEIHLARRAMRQVQAELKTDLRRLADPRLWIQSYPLACMGIAFAGSALLARRAGSKVRERAEAENELADGEKAPRGWGAGFVHDLGESLRKSLVRMFTSGLVSQALSAFQSYAPPEYSGFEDGARESAEADVGSQI